MKGNKSRDTEKQRKLIEHKTYSIVFPKPIQFCFELSRKLYTVLKQRNLLVYVVVFNSSELTLFRQPKGT